MKRLWILAIVALALPACGAPFHYTTPKGFVELEDQEAYDYRAVTADGLVVAARAIDHEPKGEISFWTEAVINHMRQSGGYALLDQREVKTSRGLTGTQLRFGHDEGQRPHLYLVTLFVTEDTIYLLETGGTREQVTAREADIDAAVDKFQPK